MLSNYLSQMMKAEEAASEIVHAAREVRIARLREAAFAAQQEADIFRREEEKKYRGLFEEHTGNADDLSRDLEEITKREVALAKKDLKTNRDIVTSFLLKRTVAVKLDLEGVQKRDLIRKDREAQGLSIDV